MSEQLNRWCKRKKSRAIIYLLPQMIFLIWLIGIKHIYYATCDDTVIHAMVSGVFVCCISDFWLYHEVPFSSVPDCKLARDNVYDIDDFGISIDRFGFY